MHARTHEFRTCPNRSVATLTSPPHDVAVYGRPTRLASICPPPTASSDSVTPDAKVVRMLLRAEALATHPAPPEW